MRNTIADGEVKKAIVDGATSGINREIRLSKKYWPGMAKRFRVLFNAGSDRLLCFL